MSEFDFIEKNAIAQGVYYLISSDHVDELYKKHGYDEDDEVPDTLKIDGRDYLFTQQFIERDGKDYEIVILANGFDWENVLEFNDDV